MPLFTGLPMKTLKYIGGALGILGGLGLLIFLFTGALDYFYVRHVVDNLEGGLSEIEWANPYLGKAVIAGISAAFFWLYFHFFAIHQKRAALFFVVAGGVSATGSFALNTVRAATGWNHYFDAYGDALRFYCITPDNKPHFFLKQRANPWTRDPLKPVTPEIVHDIEARLSSPFHEVINPEDNEWFFPGDRWPRFTYARRTDGSIHLFSALGYDPSTGQELLPATMQVKEEYTQQREIERQAAEAKKQADATAAEEYRQRQRAEQEAQAELGRLREQRLSAERQRQLSDERAQERKRIQEDERLASRRRQETADRQQAQPAESSESRPIMAEPAQRSGYVQQGSPYLINGQPPLIALLGAAISGNLGRSSGSRHPDSGSRRVEQGRRGSSHNHHPGRNSPPLTNPIAPPSKSQDTIPFRSRPVSPTRPAFARPPMRVAPQAPPTRPRAASPQSSGPSTSAGRRKAIQ